MKKLLSFALLTLLAGGCSSEESTDENSLLDMYGNEVEDVEEETVSDEEVPYSKGPTEIPDDLVIPE